MWVVIAGVHQKCPNINARHRLFSFVEIAHAQSQIAQSPPVTCYCQSWLSRKKRGFRPILDVASTFLEPFVTTLVSCALGNTSHIPPLDRFHFQFHFRQKANSRQSTSFVSQAAPPGLITKRCWTREIKTPYVRAIGKEAGELWDLNMEAPFENWQCFPPQMEPITFYLASRSCSISDVSSISPIFNEKLQHEQSYKCHKCKVLYMCLF